MSTSGNTRTKDKRRTTSIGSEGSSSSKKFKPDSEGTFPSDPSGATAGETPAAATVMWYDDNDKIGKILNKEDFKEKGVYSWFKKLLVGEVRKSKKENGEDWKDLVALLTESATERLTKALDQKSTLVLGRMAAQNFGFDEDMTHDLDVQALEARLQKIEEWHENPLVRNYRLAPLLAIIQSSGTGKSRLMNCVRNEYRKDTSRTILLAAKEFEDKEKDKIQEDFDAVYIVDKNISNGEQKRKKFDKFVREQCRKALEKSNDDSNDDSNHVRLFFDEAQHLACNEGFLIRVLRWITREQNFKVGGKRCYLTVVLAGTTSALANLFPEKEQKAGESRTIEGVSHFDEGTVPFPPFFILRTMGCLALSWDESENGEVMSTNESESKNGEVMSTNESESENGEVMSTNESEYESMIRYSRPLFAKLHKNNCFDKKREYQVVKKVVLGQLSNWNNDKKSCLSVLGTRIQMGPTSTPIVSDLVSKGYAHLTYYEHGRDDIPNRASFAFLPDPVCARVAMCLMDEEITFKGTGSTGNGTKGELDILGAGKKEMAAMMGTIFSEGVCLPAKGDYGEIATALYILFCGDVLRKKKCAEYKELSVSFSQWMRLVQNQGVDNQDSDNHDGDNNIFVNCIQFFRQDLRLKLEEMANETFLQGLYQKACAIYCANNFEAIDLVVPCYSEDENSYLPAAFSVKNYGYMSPEKATSFLKESWTKMKKAGIERGLCVLVIVGQDRPGVNVTAEDYKGQAIKIVNPKADEDRSIESGRSGGDKDQANEIAKSKADEDRAFAQALEKSPSEMIHSLVACFVCIHGDNFGIDSALKSGSTLKDHQESEVFINHSDLIQGSFSGIGISPGSNLSRFTSRYRKAAEKLFTETVNLKTEEPEGKKSSVQ